MARDSCLWNIRLTMESDGTITMSLTGLKKDVEEHELWEVLEGAGTLIKEEIAIKGTAYTKTRTIKQSLTWEGNGVGVVVKAVPDQLLSIFAADYIPRAMFDLNTYTHQVYVIESDTYLERTENVSTVLRKLGINVRVPPGLDYQVTNLSVSEGVDAYQVLKSLFPIPGATITKIRDTWFVNISLDETIFSMMRNSLCITNESEINQPILLHAIGASAKPRAESLELGGGVQCDAQYTTNLIGGIFGILRIEISNVTVQRRL